MDSVVSETVGRQLRTEPRDGPTIVYDYIAVRQQGRPIAPGRHHMYANRG